MSLRLTTHSILKRIPRSPIPSTRPITRYHPRTLNLKPSLPSPHPSPRLGLRTFTISTTQNESLKTIAVPPMAESISEGTVGSFRKQVGDYVEVDEEIASIETDKIDVSVTATSAGVVKRFLVGEGDSVAVDQGLVEIDVDAAKGAEVKEENTEVKEVKEEKKVEEKVEKTPVQEVKPEKPAPAVSPSSSPSTPSSTPPASAEQFPGYKGSRGEERVKMTRVRKRTAERLKESQTTTAFLTTFNEVDMTNIMAFRKKHKDSVLEKHATKLGFMGPVARASALALKQIPSVNAMIENEDTIVYRDYIDLSVAVATPKGLVTPVLRNIESMNIVEIEAGIAALGKKARDGQLTLEDLSGGSFTISNSGIWGSLFGTPIINMPQTAVLGIYGIQDRPVAVDGRVEIRPMMYTALTYDHRLIDGREAVTFLTLISKYLQDPASMLLD